ncbi:hypothetical protein [Ectopseudomonas khazarica]|uniref:hypothetical protein n=1 Tax=Ectopseudomonas khazarica TaxID=2502979 RepID=UPI00106E68EA|nr:hypothetical protein [Pseudomonas khazarica]
MTQAPAATVATAVRQHGGGRHPLNLLCTAPAGRLQSSRGGVIDRRAEGATSSNTLPASRAAAAHPTPGVRRARELSPSLRSQNRPHAQLVEGYGLASSLFGSLPIIAEQNISMLFFNIYKELASRGNSLVPRFDIGLRENMDHLVIDLIHPQSRVDVEQQFLCIQKEAPPFSVLLRVNEGGKALLQSSDPCPEVLFVMPSKSISAAPSPQLIKKLINLNACPEPHKSVLVLRPHLLNMTLPRVLLPLPGRYADGNEDANDGTNCLNPSRCMLTPPRHKQTKYDGRNKGVRANQESNKAGERDPYMELPIEHANLLAVMMPMSLPALCHYVQRGAA